MCQRRLRNSINKMDSLDLAKKVRAHVLRMTHVGNSSHVASALSMIDILSVIYSEMNIDPESPRSDDRDRFILSKGHAGAAIYAVLAELGFLPIEILKTHCQDGSILSGHVSHKDIPGVELSTGSLGHGLPVAVGMSYAAKLKNKKHRIFALLSDGELDEGSNWEAILFSAHHKLKNLFMIIDYNKLQSLKSIEETLELEPLKKKMMAFGWDTVELDGHNHQELMKSIHSSSDLPKCIIAHTTKGKGVSFMENKVLWHYKSPSNEELQKALEEIKA